MKKADDGKLKVEDSALKIEDSKAEDLSATIHPQKSTLNPPSSTIQKKAKLSKVAKKTTKKARKQTRGAKYQEKAQLVDRVRKYPLTEAIDLAKQTSYTKFPATLAIHINTSQAGVRGLVTLPFAAGKKLTVLAFGKGAAESGADLVGTDETIGAIEKSKIDFDVVVATPDWMPRLAKVARVLGPRGLMPNPKSGTITDNLAKAVADLQSGKTEYKTEPNGAVIHLGVGKAEQSTDEIAANIKTLFTTIGKSRVKQLVIAPTMGLGVKIDPTSI